MFKKSFSALIVAIATLLAVTLVAGPAAAAVTPKPGAYNWYSGARQVAIGVVDGDVYLWGAAVKCGDHLLEMDTWDNDEARALDGNRLSATWRVKGYKDNHYGKKIRGFKVTLALRWTAPKTVAGTYTIAHRRLCPKGVTVRLANLKGGYDVGVGEGCWPWPDSVTLARGC